MDRIGRHRRTLVALLAVAAASGCGAAPLGPESSCPGRHGVVFEAETTPTQAQPPFSPTSVVSGCVRLPEDAVVPGLSTVEPEHLVTYHVSVGSASWSGTGSEFEPIGPLRRSWFRLTLSADTRTVMLEHLSERHNRDGLALDVSTVGEGPAVWRVHRVGDTLTLAYGAEGLSFSR